MIKRTIVVLGVCMGPGIAHARGRALLEAGQSYSRVHALLVRAGYRPFRVLVPNSGFYHRNIFNRGDVYRLYPEVLDCAGSGLGDCNFVLIRGGRDVVVAHTTGEYAGSLVFRDLRHVTVAEAGALYR